MICNNNGKHINNKIPITTLIIPKNALKKSEHLPNYANKVNKDNINIK